jgi:riboflavin biosynthesis pyrimidine reductase
MSALTPLQERFDAITGDDVPLPGELARLVGRFRIPRHPARPHVVGNFVASLDGVVSLAVPGKAGGGPISGFNRHDRLMMGLLRAVADAVIIGAGTLRASTPDHRLTAEYVLPPLAADYQTLRAALGKPKPPLNVVVTASGEIDLGRPLFHPDGARSLIITTADGARRLCAHEPPPSVQIVTAAKTGPLPARSVLDAVCRTQQTGLVLIEAGPHLMGDFLAERLLDELFLTLAPQVAGRDEVLPRPGLVAGKRFAPEDPRWGTLLGIKQGGDHLFLRYAFATSAWT